MFQRVRQYPLISGGGRIYRPRVYGEPQLDGRWGGWIVFFPLDRSPAIATDRETTQTTFEGLAVWAAGLTLTYLEGALVRALQLAVASAVVDQLSDTEYAALELEDAEQLEAAAEIKRASADIDETAAAHARAEAERIRRERLVTESQIAATEEATANLEADLNERAARTARAVAADAARRSRRANAGATRRTGTRLRTRKKR